VDKGARLGYGHIDLLERLIGSDGGQNLGVTDKDRCDQIIDPIAICGLNDSRALAINDLAIPDGDLLQELPKQEHDRCGRLGGIHDLRFVIDGFNPIIHMGIYDLHQLFGILYLCLRKDGDIEVFH